MKKLLFGVLFFVSVNGVYGQGLDWQWARNPTGKAYSHDVTTDVNGNIFVTGFFLDSTLKFGNIILTNSGGGDFFIAKYDRNGNVLWAKSAIGSSLGGDDDSGDGIVTDAGGNVYVTGSFFSTTLTFGSTTLSNAGNADFFIAKYDANGNELWAKRAGGIDVDASSWIAIDTTGYIYVTGSFYSPNIVFGNDTLRNNSNNYRMDLFVVKYDLNGNVIWAKSFGGNGKDEGIDIATDNAGNIYITGSYASNTIVFGNTILTNNTFFGSCDVFLAKLDNNGNLLWAKSGNGDYDEEGWGVTVDVSGNVLITGFFQSPSITSGNITLINDSTNGYADAFIFKFDSTGNILWGRRMGSEYGEIGSGITVDKGGNAYLTGYFASPSVIFGSTTLFNTGINNGDIFVAKYDSNGNPLWAKSAVGGGDEWSLRIAVDASENIYITGYFLSSTLTFGSTSIMNADSLNMFVAKLSLIDVLIENYTTNKSLLIYPIPTRNTLTVAFNSNTFNKTQITLTDLTGRLILKKSFPAAVGDSRIDIDVSGVASGVYIVTVGDGEREMRGKVVVE